MLLYLLRHGETKWNALRRIQGSTDIELNEKGIALAKATGEALKDVHFDLAVSSPLKRAVDTAKYVLGDRDVPLIRDERIQEINFGIIEGCSIEGAFSPDFECFFHDPWRFTAPRDGENIVQVCDRTREFWKELTENPKLQDSTVLITTHGCALRALLQNVYEPDGDFWHGSVPPNCCVNIVEVKNGQARLLAEDQVYGS